MSTFKESFTNYDVFLGRRFYIKEKLKFLLYLKKDFEEAGFNVNTTQSKQEFLSEKVTYHNLYAGDLKKAKVVFATYYDTPAHELGSRYYEPLAGKRSRLSWFSKLIFPISILLITVGVFYYLLYPQIAQNGVWSFNGIMALVFLFISFALIRHYRNGIPKRQNFVRNTSSVLAMILYARRIKNNPDIAFAFIDGGVTTNYGIIMLKDKLSTSKAKVIYLDSIGGQGNLHVFTDDVLNINNSEVSEHLNNEQLLGFEAILVSSGQYKDDKIRVDTKKYDEDIEKIEEQLNNIINILDLVAIRLLNK